MLIFGWVYSTGIFILFHVQRMTDKNWSRVMKSRSTSPEGGDKSVCSIVSLIGGKMTMKRLKYFTKILVTIFTFSLLWIVIARAQIPPQADTTRQSFFQRYVKLSGEISTYGELYSISGRERRRPASTGRLYFRPTISLFNTFSMSFDFLLSTEGSSARQNINQLGLYHSWSWGVAHIGDFTETFTPLTFSGVLIRGGGVSINPGVFRFSAVGGLTKRAVAGGAENGSYERYLYGVKIGVGKESSSFFDLMFLRVRDNPSSLPPSSPSITVIAPNGGEVLPVGTTQTIRWSAAGIGDQVKIELSRDGGNSFEIIFSSTPNDGLEQWIVTGPPTLNAVIRVSSLNDSVSDVSDAPFEIGGTQYQPGATPPNVADPYAVTPQENLVVGANTVLRLFESALTLKGEVSGSVYTRDMRAADLESIEIPSFMKQIYKPRVSTRVDYAYTTEINLNLSHFSAKAGYRYLGPGYTSLGVASLLTDQQEMLLGAGLRFQRWSIALDGGRQNDNLIGQKLYTTTRNRIGGSLNIRPLDEWSATILSNYLTMENDAKSDTMRIAYHNLMVGTNHVIMFGEQALVQTATASYMYQTSADGNPFRKNLASTSHTVNLSLVLAIAPNLIVTPSASVVRSQFGGAERITTQTYTVASQYRGFESKLVTSLSISASIMGNKNSLQSILSSSYQITNADIATVSIRITNYRGIGKYDENVANLTVSHQF
jgi:hypothetical protein